MIEDDYKKDEPLIEERIQRIEKEMQEEPKGKEPFQPLSVKDILLMEETEEPFLIETLVPLKGLTVLSGYPSCGKSWILLYFAYCVATGEALFKIFKTNQGNVLIIDEESGVGEFKRRLKLMNFPADLPIFFFSQQGFKVDDKDCLDNLLKVVQEKKIKLVIFDPFSAIHSKPENVAEEMQKVMECLQKFNLAGASVIFAHHYRKELGWKTSMPSQSLRGSSVLFGRVDSHLAVEKGKVTESQIDLMITQAKLRRGRASDPLLIKLIEENGVVSLEFVTKFQEEEKKIEEAKKIVLEVLKEKEAGCFREEVLAILKENGIGGRNGDDALRALEESNEIKSKFIGKKKFYYLPEIETEKIDSQ